jgi:hypothetical protein
MTSGMHTIQSIFCQNCSTELGWAYVKAASPENQHKVGNFILVQPDILERTRGGAKSVRKRKRTVSMDRGSAEAMEAACRGWIPSSAAASAAAAAAASPASPALPYATLGRAPRIPVRSSSQSSAASASSSASASSHASSSLLRAAARGRSIFLAEESEDEEDSSADEAAAEAAEWARGEGRAAAASSGHSIGAHEDLLHRLRALRRILGASSMVLHMHSPPPPLAATPLAGGPAPRPASPPAAAAASAAPAAALAAMEVPPRRRRMQLFQREPDPPSER